MGSKMLILWFGLFLFTGGLMALHSQDLPSQDAFFDAPKTCSCPALVSNGKTTASCQQFYTLLKNYHQKEKINRGAITPNP